MEAISEYGHSIKTWKSVLRCSGFYRRHGRRNEDQKFQQRRVMTGGPLTDWFAASCTPLARNERTS
jgi:hypothetical protein